MQAGQKAYGCGQDVCCVWHSTQPVGSEPLITDFTGFNQSSVSAATAYWEIPAQTEALIVGWNISAAEGPDGVRSLRNGKW